MTKIHHLNCVQIESPLGSAIGHCLLIEETDGLILIDAGIGRMESREPEKRLGKELIEATGYVFDEKLSAIHQIEQRGFPSSHVKHIICSHLDPDHIGGLADFPNAQVHVSKEEYDSFLRGDDRYLPQQLAHQPDIKLYADDDAHFLELPARKVGIRSPNEIYLIPLFGHTLGHCGVGIKTPNQWIFYAGDAYYLRAELENKRHPVDQLATLRAVDNPFRKESLEKVRTLIQNYGNQLEYFAYHDPSELTKA